MVKAGRHYLPGYSDGNTTKDTYEVGSAVGATLMGPVIEAANRARS